MRLLLILSFFLFSLSVAALPRTLHVGEKKEYALLPHASLYDNHLAKMGIEEVQEVRWKDVHADELAFPVSPAAHWLRYSVENNTTESKAYYLEYPVSNIHFLDVYVLQKGLVLQRYLTGGYKPLHNRALVYHSFLFPIMLEPGEKKEIYVRLKHLISSVSANMILKEQTAFLLDDYAENVLEGVFFGVMIAMFFYNLILYMMTRFKPYIAYILYLGSFGTWLSLRMGYGQYLFDFMSVEIYRYFELTISMLFTVFIIWFINGVLELKKALPKAYIFLNIMSALFVVSWSMICLLMLLEIEGYFKYPSNLFFINFLVMNISIAVVSMILAIRGNRTAFYILTAWMLFLSSMVILMLSKTGVIPHYEWIMPYMQVTMVIETVMLSLILGDRYRQQEQLLREQSRLASMGSMIENIAHQWRQPLSEINADLLALEMHIEDDDKENIKKRMQIIEEKTEMMSETIDDFQNFYAQDKPREKFNLGDIIEKSIHLLEDRMVKNHIQYTVHSRETFTLYGVENEYLQVLLAILNNAIDALKENDKEDRILDIFLSKEEKNTVLQIKNNGKQITARDLMRIFEPYYTTKEGKGQHGIGLFMSKRIIEESFHGSLEIENAPEGVNVTIKVEYV